MKRVWFLVKNLITIETDLEKYFIRDRFQSSRMFIFIMLAENQKQQIIPESFFTFDCAETNTFACSAHVIDTCEKKRVDYLLSRSKSLNSVSKMLRADSTTFSDICTLFDAVLSEFRETKSGLCSQASIVHCPLAESAVLEIQTKDICGFHCKKRTPSLIYYYHPKTKRLRRIFDDL